MAQTLHIIPLRTIRYSDRNSILSVYSLERGALALSLPEGNGKNAVRLRALTMPLSLIECEVEIRPGRSIYNFKEMRPTVTLASLRSNPMKMAVTQFLAELLGGVLREGQPDNGLYSFIASSIEWLDSAPAGASANFHLVFLYKLGGVLGIAPDVTTWRQGSYFDLADGIFRTSPPLHPHYLSCEESAVAPLLDRLTYRSMGMMKLSQAQRNRMLDVELQFFSLHYSGVSGLKSLPVLRMLF